MDSESAVRLGVDISAMFSVIITDWRSNHSLGNFDGDEDVIIIAIHHLKKTNVSHARLLVYQ